MKKNASFFETTKGLITIIAVVIFIYFCSGAFMWFHYFRHNPAFAGTFGDMFGVVTSFFSAITVILVFYASRLQKQELDTTRKEFVQQNETTKLQRFETTFFNLLGLNNQIKKELSLSLGVKPQPYGTDAIYVENRVDGIHVLENIVVYWNEKFKTADFQTQYTDVSRSWFVMKYNDGDKREMEIPHYYNHIMNIFTFIKDAGLNRGQVKFYVRTFTTLLAPVEIALLYFYVGLQRELDPELRQFITSQDFFYFLRDTTFFADVSYLNINYPNKVPVSNSR